MADLFYTLKNNVRTVFQFCFAAFTNGYAAGFLKGNIYKGPSKALCLPGLNCYSCPGALGACPIGSFQAVIGSRDYRFAFYVAGFLMFFGAVFGRLVCGWMCPFGLVQDLLYKIPFIKKIRHVPFDKYLKYFKYFILAGFVIILPLTVLDIVGQGQPWFCKYICPSGTLFAGVPLITLNPSLQASLGGLFALKIAILTVLIVASVIIYRPFCRYICPLGAVYGMFNGISVYRYNIDDKKCTKCGKCQRICKIDIPVYKSPNSPECIRCGECKKACPHNAIGLNFSKSRGEKKK